MLWADLDEHHNRHERRMCGFRLDRSHNQFGTELAAHIVCVYDEPHGWVSTLCFSFTKESAGKTAAALARPSCSIRVGGRPTCLLETPSKSRGVHTSFFCALTIHATPNARGCYLTMQARTAKKDNRCCKGVYSTQKNIGGLKGSPAVLFKTPNTIEHKVQKSDGHSYAVGKASL